MRLPVGLSVGHNFESETIIFHGPIYLDINLKPIRIISRLDFQCLVLIDLKHDVSHT